MSDKKTSELGELFFEFSKKNNVVVEHFVIDELKIHGEEPPKNIADCMKRSNLILGLTKLSMAHSKARFVACSRGNRYLSLPDYSKEILMHKALRENFYEKGEKAKNLADKLTNSQSIKIISKNGTNLDLDVRNRKGNFAPGYVNDELLLGSPPDIEANIAPVENNSNGIVMVDGSIPFPDIGLLEKPVSLKINNGKITSISGEKPIQSKLENTFQKYGPKSRILAELGIGFNHKAQLCGNMLIDEGSYGTIHLGFGSNLAFGGLNNINFHLDFVLYQQNLIIDGESIKI
ncbi:MAG: aminopeptidase [Bacteroidetes bacterium]|nr:aminopeptidase [Bacteroidota bacterium]